MIPNRRIARGLKMLEILVRSHSESIEPGDRTERRRANEAIDVLQWLRWCASDAQQPKLEREVRVEIDHSTFSTYGHPTERVTLSDGLRPGRYRAKLERIR